MRKPRPREEGWVRVSWGAGQGHLGLASGSLAALKPILLTRDPGVSSHPSGPQCPCLAAGGWARPSPRTHLRPGLRRPVSEARGPGLQALTWRLCCTSAFRPPSRLAPALPRPPSPGRLPPAHPPRLRGVSDPSTGHCAAPAVRPGCCASSIFQHQPMKDSQASPFTGGGGLCTCGAPTARSEHTGRGQLCPST